MFQKASQDMNNSINFCILFKLSLSDKWSLEVVRARLDIQRGEEICISYLSEAAGTQG